MQQNKKLILNADDFGMTKQYNYAVLDGFNNGILTSACVCANGEAFEHAMKEILPQCSGMGLGVHLNFIEGKTFRENLSSTILCDKNKLYSSGFLGLLFKSMNSLFIKELEVELRSQIEKVLEYATPDHINSHVHTHSIPEIFELTCKLADEYKIPFIRTQSEKFYAISGSPKNRTKRFWVNLIKVALLNYFSAQNKQKIKKYNVKTNDYLIGVGYTGFMDADTVYWGLKEINQPSLTEVLMHPCVSIEGEEVVKERYDEYKLLVNEKLRAEILNMGFELTNYKQLMNNML